MNLYSLSIIMDMRKIYLVDGLKGNSEIQLQGSHFLASHCLCHSLT